MSERPWAAVALRTGAIPPPAVMRGWIDRHAPRMVVEIVRGDDDDADAERRYEFVEGQARVGAMHFPWTVWEGQQGGPLKEHASHVFLSVKEPGRQNGREGRRLLARAASAIAATGDAAFVWWGRTGGVYQIRKFLDRVETR